MQHDSGGVNVVDVVAVVDGIAVAKLWTFFIFSSFWVWRQHSDSKIMLKSHAMISRDFSFKTFPLFQFFMEEDVVRKISRGKKCKTLALC